ncbi:cysteine desulfurase family protein [Treponema sp.]|uniref:cysteine desulfurase family protein n=1 Tax=Treponema sp. TaxID=166 RepID=UPI0025FC2038|nr:cysteine desulfurase family protein [Treponema sp.]MCR5219116.1 cysteine desulfurase [Treponema sp.]
MFSREHYFDSAATSFPDADILREALEYSLQHWANPSSIHAAGSDAKKALEACRSECAAALGVKPQTLFFTSGGTESDHIPLLSVLSRPQKGSVIVSAIEHPALREMSKMMTNTGWKTITVNPDKNGFIQPESIINALQDDTVFVTVMAVNNETGAVQDIEGIADALSEYSANHRKVFFHVDCVQAAGKIPFDLNHKGIDSAAFSGHKIHGPRGIGLLYLNREINSFLKGGGQEKSVRSGTENLFGAKALALCLKKYHLSQKNPQTMEALKNQEVITSSFIRKISSFKNCTIIPHCRGQEGDSHKFSPYVLQASFAGIPGQVMERALSEKGFYISTGSACSSNHAGRPVLDTMQLSAKEKESAVRFSFDSKCSQQDIDQLYQALEEIVKLFT